MAQIFHSAARRDAVTPTFSLNGLGGLNNTPHFHDHQRWNKCWNRRTHQTYEGQRRDVCCAPKLHTVWCILVCIDLFKKCFWGLFRVLESFLSVNIGLKRSTNDLKQPSWSLVMTCWNLAKCMEFYGILRRSICWDKRITVQFLAQSEFFRYDPDRIKLREHF